MAKTISFYFDVEGNEEKRSFVAQAMKEIIVPKGWEAFDQGMTIYAANIFNPDRDVDTLISAMAQYMHEKGTGLDLTGNLVIGGMARTEFRINGNEACVTANIDYDVVLPEDAESEDDAEWKPIRTAPDHFDPIWVWDPTAVSIKS